MGENVIRREARVGRDGRFHLDGPPPGRYGLKVGHDAYRDPHIPEIGGIGQERTPQQRALWRKKAEPWQGAVEAIVRRAGPPPASSSTSAPLVRSRIDYILAAAAKGPVPGARTRQSGADGSLLSRRGAGAIHLPSPGMSRKSDSPKDSRPCWSFGMLIR